jgi:hypothetical protein
MYSPLAGLGAMVMRVGAVVIVVISKIFLIAADGLAGLAWSRRKKVYLLRRNIKTKRPSSKLDFTKLGPFEIEEKKGPLNYKLRLPEGTRLHPVFHIALLEPADPKTPLQTDITGIDPEFEIPSYNVEKILDMRIISNRPHYLVKWKGFAHTENTWEPIENVKNSQRLVARFHQTNPDVPAPEEQQTRNQRKDHRPQRKK